MASRDDVFFRLTPHARPENARKVFELPHNARWLQTSTTDIATKPTIGSRETTPAVVPESQFDPRSHSDRLALTFSGLLALVKSGKLPSLEAGIRFGTDPNHCHILLGHRGTQGVSGQQYTLSVNQDLSVWLCDHGSKHGTAVMCNKQNGGQFRRSEKWILSNCTGNPGPYSQIVIQAGRVSLEVELPNHTHPSLLYRESLQRLYAECQEAARYRDDSASTFMGLGLNSCPSTAAASGAMTPDTRPLYYSTAVLGKGVFGEVSLVIQARTGRYFAAKTFADQNKKRRAEEKDEAWRVKVRREFDIAAENLHDNIVRAFELQEEPMAIIMEYYPDGNIEDMRQNMNETTYVSAFGQILCALEHLHARGIVHRDLKPQNVLVQMGPCFKVALTDFGLSNVIQGGTLLNTFCGTLPFTAPEVYPGPGAGYDTSADIWSLGAIMLGWMYDLPEMPSEFDKERPAVWASRWHFILIRRLRDQDDCAMTALISSMMKPISHHRWDAKQCLRHGFDHQLFRWRKGDGLVVCIDDLIECEAEPDANDQAGINQCTAPTERKAHSTTNAIEEEARSNAPKSTVSLVRDPPLDFDHNVSELGLPDPMRTLGAGGATNDCNRVAEVNTVPLNVRESSDSRRGLVPCSRLLRPRSGRKAPLQGPVKCGEPEQAIKQSNQRRDNALSDGSRHGALLKEVRTTNCIGVSDNVNIVCESSHHSILEVFTDIDQAYVLMEGKRLSLRLSDYYLNAYQILVAARISSKTQIRMIAGYEKAGIGEPGGQAKRGRLNYWLPFPFGVQLCRAHGIDGGLGELFARSALPLPAPYSDHFSKPPRLPTRLPEGFKSLVINDTEIVYKQAELLINASHVCKVYGQKKAFVSRYRRSQGATAIKTLKGNSRTQGVYITFHAAQALCMQFNLIIEPLWNLITCQSRTPTNDLVAKGGHQHTNNDHDGDRDNIQVEGNGDAGYSDHDACNNGHGVSDVRDSDNSVPDAEANDDLVGKEDDPDYGQHFYLDSLQGLFGISGVGDYRPNFETASAGPLKLQAQKPSIGSAADAIPGSKTDDILETDGSYLAPAWRSYANILD